MISVREAQDFDADQAISTVPVCHLILDRDSVCGIQLIQIFLGSILATARNQFICDFFLQDPLRNFWCLDEVLSDWAVPFCRCLATLEAAR